MKAIISYPISKYFYLTITKKGNIQNAYITLNPDVEKWFYKHFTPFPPLGEEWINEYVKNTYDLFTRNSTFGIKNPLNFNLSFEEVLEKLSEDTEDADILLEDTLQFFNEPEGEELGDFLDSTIEFVKKITNRE